MNKNVSSLFNIPLDGGPSTIPSSGEARPKSLQGPDQSRTSPNGGGRVKFEETDPKHRGAAGVARDIFGTLGDFLLTRLGMPAMYAPAQQQRRMAQAMQGIDEDPIGTFQRVGALDAPFAAKLREQYIDNQRLEAQQASTEEARAARISLAEEARFDKVRDYSASMLSGLVDKPEKDRPALYAKQREQILKLHPDLAKFLPETYDPEAIDAFIDMSVPVRTQRQQRLAVKKMEQQQEQFEQRDATTKRGQDITAGNAVLRSETTKRGQDISSSDRRRGQDISSTDRRRGQNITAGGRAASLAETTRSNKAREARVPAGKIYRQNGVNYRYNPKTKKWDVVK